MSLSRQVEHVVSEARRAAARGNGWPGLPVSSLPLSLGAALREGIDAGVLRIETRASRIAGFSDPEYIVAVNR